MAQLDPAERAVVRTARQRFEAAKLEVSVKADTAARYWKAWQESRKRLGPAGDPALRRTADTEMKLFERQVEAIVKPAARAYADAVARAVKSGNFSLAGSYSAENALKRLMDLDASAQGAGEDFFLPPNEWAAVLDKVAQYAHRMCIVEKDPRGFKLAVMCLHLAEIYNAKHAPWIRSLQQMVDEMITR